VYNYLKLAATQETIRTSNNLVAWICKATAKSQEEIEQIQIAVEEKEGITYVYSRAYLPKKIQKEFVRQFYKLPTHGH
jgi:hypothetical protein